MRLFAFDIGVLPAPYLGSIVGVLDAAGRFLQLGEVVVLIEGVLITRSRHQEARSTIYYTVQKHNDL